MAARSDEYPQTQHQHSIVDLRQVSPEDLGPLLDEETAEWNTKLDWDFKPSADLVRRFVHLQALGGFAFLAKSGSGSRVTGYSYYVCEEGKGLIGDLYMMRAERSVEGENALLETVLRAMWRTPGVRRVESQIMLLSSPMERSVPQQNWFRACRRYFLEAPLGSIVRLPAKTPTGTRTLAWSDSRHDEAARLIATSYQGHVDSQVNDQYRSPAGARRFLTNIVQFPGCGTFFAPASYVATDMSGRDLRGISLASLVAADVGHITQVCVAPSARGTGLGYELVRQSLIALAANGCRTVSLTVTAANAPALQLYQRMGFVKRREFAAYVWDRG